MNKIEMNSRTDWLLDSCYYNCFVCSKPFKEPPLLDKNGVLRGRALCFYVIDEDGSKVENEERICNQCWVSDLSQFAIHNTCE